ncbi:MAG TPA: histidine kinase [Actinocrinis sp.]|uniref:sensor histidine kinase n=1 Tax=Actinocrinis sp. TaxID=1920516 RepID=UPI002D70015A|nr:histidine kinase [Actinocrinis sp.]HZU56481.1 histidine kinase [Actinocrinis sp.]
MAADRTTPHGRADAENGQAEAADAGQEALAPRIARNILLFLLCSFVFTGVLNIPANNPGDHAGNTGAYACMAVVFILQLLHSSARAPSWPLRLRALTLSLQTAATYLPFVAFHQIWGGMAGFLGGSFILLLRRPLSWILFAVCPLSMMWLGAASHEGLVWIAYLGVATTNTALVIYGLTKLTDLVSKLHEARAELARLAVARERQRFSRDLHDLLGYSLSSITLKSELAYRLAEGQAERARAELASILEISRQALSDLRTVASSYRDLCFTEEVSTVESMLLATGVDVSVEVSLPELPPAVDTVFATVLREGVTNMLRHSKVERCSITGRTVDGNVRLELVNDGVGAGSGDAADPVGSSGLGSLAQRLAAIGGQLAAGVRSDSMFQLVAQAPLRNGKVASERLGPIALLGSRGESARPTVDLANGE